MTRQVTVPIAPEFLTDLLKSPLQFRVKDRLPQDAMLVGVSYNRSRDQFELIYDSPSFSEHGENVIPIRLVTLTTEG